VRFGMSGAFLPEDVDDVTAAVAQRVRALGFSGVFTRFAANDPTTVRRERCERARALLEDAGLRTYQATGYWQPLVHPDDGERREAVRVLQAALRMAGWLGARAIDTGPGSLAASGPWGPHPYARSAQARHQLVRSLRECAAAAEQAGVLLCLEGHVLVCIDSAEAMRDVLDEVGSPWVRADFDPVNWITLDTIFDTGAAIGQMLDVLGDRVASAHAKDVVLWDRLVLHLDQTAAGLGVLDYDVFLRRMDAYGPDVPVIVEAAEEADLPRVAAFLHERAQRLGIAVVA
jgi:sugar phosphate isomerase/epimerase